MVPEPTVFRDFAYIFVAAHASGLLARRLALRFRAWQFQLPSDLGFHLRADR
jgi:hypothetical protein